MSQEQTLQLEQILSPQLTYSRLKGCSKKRLLQFIASEAANSLEMNFDAIYKHLMDRERLGCTAVGEGIAIPHCKLEALDHPLAILTTLDEPIGFDAADDQPVDLVFVLFVPNGEDDQYKELLTHLAQRLNETDYCHALRKAKSSETLYQAAIYHYPNH